MYIFLNSLPQKEDMKEFQAHQSINENYINYRINYQDLSREKKEQLIKKYKLNKELIRSDEDIFLSIPVTKVNQNISIEEKQCI